jgi:apolipoprotein N-acyltransferase
LISLNEDPDWLLNVSNDGWFGNSTGPQQHLFMIKFRAVEYGLPVVRAATTGVSAVIDPYGRIVEMVEYGEPGIIETRLPHRIGGNYYMKLIHLGFSAISLSLFLIMIIIGRKTIGKRSTF